MTSVTIFRTKVYFFCKGNLKIKIPIIFSNNKTKSYKCGIHLPVRVMVESLLNGEGLIELLMKTYVQEKNEVEEQRDEAVVKEKAADDKLLVLKEELEDMKKVTGPRVLQSVSDFVGYVEELERKAEGLEKKAEGFERDAEFWKKNYKRQQEGTIQDYENILVYVMKHGKFPPPPKPLVNPDIVFDRHHIELGTRVTPNLESRYPNGITGHGDGIVISTDGDNGTELSVLFENGVVRHSIHCGKKEHYGLKYL